MKNFIRKIAAVGTSVALLGMTVGGAVALDLGDLPEPFVVSDEYVSTAMVIGNTLDASARTTLKTYFDGFIDESVGDVTSVSDTEKIYLGEDLSHEFASLLDDGEIDDLWDDSITFEGESYETHESVYLNGSVKFTCSGLENDEDLSAGPVVYTNSTNSWGYRYYFDESFTDSISSSDELSITFLGKEIKISSVNGDPPDSVTIKTGTDVSAGQNSEFTVDGHIVHVGTIFEASVEIWVDNEDHVFMDTGDTETFNIGTDQVEITLEDIGYTDDVDSRTVLLTYGEDISTTVKDGDAVQTEMGEPDVDDDSSDAVWNWDIHITQDSNFTSNDYVGIVYYQKINKHDDDPAPLGDGDYFATPYNYLTLDYDLVEPDYNEYNVEFDEGYDINSTVEQDDVIIFTAVDGAAGNDGFVYTSIDTNRVVCNATASCWYEDSDGDFNKLSALADDNSEFYIESGTGTTKSITFWKGNGTASYVGTGETIAEVRIQDVESTDDGPMADSYISFNVSIGNVRLGRTIGDSEVEDLKYYDAGTLREIGTWDDGDLRTAYGIKVVDIDTNAANDELVFHVPEKEIYGDFSFSMRGTGSTSEVDLLTASESVTGYTNLILVGGPAVNSVTADFMGLTFPAYAEASTIAADSAIIQLVEKDTQTALIVAGWETADTQRAATNVAAGDLTGDSLVV